MMVTLIMAKTMVFDDKGNLLVLKRSLDDDHRPGGYDLPGGGVDSGESYVDGAVREALEEVNLVFRPDDLQLVFATSYSGPKADYDQDVNVVWLGYATRLPQGQTVRLSHEHQSYQWLSWREVTAIAMDSSNIRNFIEHLQASGLYRQFTGQGKEVDR